MLLYLKFLGGIMLFNLEFIILKVFSDPTLSLSRDGNVITLEFICDENADVNDLLDTKNIITKLKEKLEELKALSSFFQVEEEIYLIDYLIENFDNIDLLNNLKYVILHNDLDTFTFYKKNPTLKQYPILLVDLFKVSRKSLENATAYFKETDNFFYKLDKNEKEISYDDYVKTVELCDEILQEVIQYDFSPLEQLMYVYDLIRERVYTAENPEEEYFVSRDITSVLLGDKIVCVGFSNLFAAIIENLEFNSKPCFLFNSEKISGHRRNIVEIHDDKYQVDGVYYFDTTWDSKHAGDNSYLNSYLFFSRTKDDMDIITSNHYINITFNGFDKNFVKRIKSFLKNHELSELSDDDIAVINSVSSFLMHRSLILKEMFEFESLPFFEGKKKITKIYVIDKLRDFYLLLYPQRISADKLLDCFITVRPCEYLKDSEKYPFDRNTILRTLYNSRWCFEEDKSLLLILDVIPEVLNYNMKVNSQAFENYMEKEKVNDIIEQVRQLKISNDKKMK